MRSKILRKKAFLIMKTKKYEKVYFDNEKTVNFEFK